MLEFILVYNVLIAVFGPHLTPLETIGVLVAALAIIVVIARRVITRHWFK